MINNPKQFGLDIVSIAKKSPEISFYQPNTLVPPVGFRVYLHPSIIRIYQGSVYLGYIGYERVPTVSAYYVWFGTGALGKTVTRRTFFEKLKNEIENQNQA